MLKKYLIFFEKNAVGIKNNTIFAKNIKQNLLCLHYFII